MHPMSGKYIFLGMLFLSVIGLRVKPSRYANIFVNYAKSSLYRLEANPAQNVCITINGNGQERMLQIDAPPVENFWLRH